MIGSPVYRNSLVARPSTDPPCEPDELLLLLHAADSTCGSTVAPGTQVDRPDDGHANCGGVGLREGMSEAAHEMCHALCTRRAVGVVGSGRETVVSSRAARVDVGVGSKDEEEEEVVVVVLPAAAAVAGDDEFVDNVSAKGADRLVAVPVALRVISWKQA
jgi:hypothetical protein